MYIVNGTYAESNPAPWEQILPKIEAPKPVRVVKQRISAGHQILNEKCRICGCSERNILAYKWTCRGEHKFSCEEKESLWDSDTFRNVLFAAGLLLLIVGICVCQAGYSDSRSFSSRIEHLKSGEIGEKQRLETKQVASDQQTAVGALMILVGGLMFLSRFLESFRDVGISFPDTAHIYRAGSLLQRQHMNHTLDNIRDHFDDL